MLKQLLPNRQNFNGADLIFTLNAAAQKRAASGAPVINATIGALLDDHGKLVVLDTVMQQYSLLTPPEIAPYAPIAGDAAYLLALTQRQWPELTSYGAGVATPGGSGALALSIRNLLEPGQTLLSVAPFWGPYTTLAGENSVSLETVPYPAAGAAADIAVWREACTRILKQQGRLLFWLNDPCHNPTGRSLSAADRSALFAALRDVSTLGPVTLLLDLAYLDYTRHPQDVRIALDEYRDFAEEGVVLVGAALSLSKAFTIYGARAGALVFPWSNDPALQSALATSCRGSFSNCARAPMSVLLRVSRDAMVQASLASEHAHWNVVLAERADALDSALKAEGLSGAPWQGGFFVALETQNAFAVCEELQEDGVFVVPMPEGLRVGICGLKKQDAPRFAASMRRRIQLP
ncbi:MAG: aminotransferase class I/II-fold pyridoxal phosphate-dependent enzyme [Phycisphaerae bacterium]|nr:aminotransferase class I/II-fold pyridoxal phosphate-dependent enzyme [Gemmatimonadaceae bacterium]